MLLFVDKHKDGAKMDVVSNHLPGNCSFRNFFTKISCYWDQGGTLPRAIWGTSHLLRQPIHVVQSRYSPMVWLMFSEYPMKWAVKILLYSRIGTHHAPSANLNFYRFDENPPEKRQLRLSSRQLERQLFTLQVLPSPWGKLRRTWRSVGQVGNCLARASPRLDVAIFLENILWIPTRTWGSKPMSNILSASSRIIMVIRRRLVTWK